MISQLAVMSFLATCDYVFSSHTWGPRREFLFWGGNAMKNLFKNYGLSLVLAALFLVSWGMQTWTGWMKFQDEQKSHGQTAQVFGSGGYVWEWGEATFENWQSEFLQLLSFVVLTSFLIHKGSHESKDSDEEMQSQLNRIERKLSEMSGGGGSQARKAS
jgi:hypothetical protein